MKICLYKYTASQAKHHSNSDWIRFRIQRVEKKGVFMVAAYDHVLPLKRTATLMISTFYQKELYEP